MEELKVWRVEAGEALRFAQGDMSHVPRQNRDVRIHPMAGNWKVRALYSPSAETMEGLYVMKLNVNRKSYEIEVDPEKPLLWVIREELGLTGTKFGCGMAQCGACTVHLDGEAIRSCVTPVSEVGAAEVTTIEGLVSELGKHLHAAFIAEDVPQCGYCQPGQIMSAAGLLGTKPKPTDDDIDDAMSGNLCRCGTYQRIRKAIHLAAKMKAAEAK